MEHAQYLAEVIQAETSKKAALLQKHFAGLYSEGLDPTRDFEKIAVVNQTTLLRNETLTIIGYLRKVMTAKYGESKVANHLWSEGKGDTLCYATQVNQDALQQAFEQPIDAALVVGGKNSSNTASVLSVSEKALITFSLRAISFLLKLFSITFFLITYPKVLPRSKKSVLFSILQ